MKIFKILISFSILFLLNGCLEDPQFIMTKVKTLGFVDYVQDGALVSGSFEDGNKIYAKLIGICYGRNPNPSIDNFTALRDSNILDDGVFNCKLVDLEDSTKYYARAFAYNLYGVVYGEEISFVSLSKPKVSTLKITENATNQLVVECDLSSKGSRNVDLLGICLSQNSKEPTIEADSCIWVNKSEAGKYSVNISVNPISKTYIRAVARNLAGVSYGKTLTYITNDFPDFKEHEFVDLGLSSRTLWATCNIGANSPEEYGNYFAWGETESKSVYNWNTYRWCSGASTKLTKYCIASSNGVVDNKTTLEPEDDAAKVLWGGDWRMPTVEEQDELLVECNWTWTTQNGVKGYKVVSKKNGNSIFIPASGYRSGSSLYDTGSIGVNWSCSLGDPADLASHIGFLEDEVALYIDERCIGATIRPVLPVGITYSVSFNSNRGEGTMESIIVTENSSITIPENKFTLSGYKFVGWNTKADGTGDSYSVGQIIQLSNNMILYAQWEEEETIEEPSEDSIYNVTFDSNKGEGSMQSITVDYAEQISIPESQFIKNCHAFKNWNEKSDGTGTSYEVGQTISISKDMTLYAQWKVKNYTISYNPNGGEGEAFDVSVECGMGGTNKNTFTREGYTFVGWNTKADGTGDSYSDHQELLVENNITLYAQWEKAFVLSYNPNGGNGEVYEVIVKEGTDKQIKDQIFYKTCYEFTGWNEKPDGTGTSYTWEQSISITKNMTLYAQWKLQTYTISYNSNGGYGEGTIYDENVDCGSTVTLKENIFTRDGYTFVGWNTEPDGTGVIYTESQDIELMKDMTLYAQWEKAFVLSYNPNGANGEMLNIVAKYGEVVEVSTNTFTLDNYYFIGWNTKENGSGTTYKVGQEIQIVDDITLYAQWVTYVDLGLPSGTLWATCNVGAYTPEGVGSRFAWGETEPKESYSWSNYKWCYGTSDSMNKYYSNYGFGTFDNKTTLDLEDDAAYVNWGEDWRMPTSEEMKELYSNYCYWTQTSENGIPGYKITSKVNGNSIFLPYTNSGYHDYDYSDYHDYGYYWSNNRSYYSYEADCLAFHYYRGNVVEIVERERSKAYPIRPVLR